MNDTDNLLMHNLIESHSESHASSNSPGYHRLKLWLANLEVAVAV